MLKAYGYYKLNLVSNHYRLGHTYLLLCYSLVPLLLQLASSYYLVPSLLLQLASYPTPISDCYCLSPTATA